MGIQSNIDELVDTVVQQVADKMKLNAIRKLNYIGEQCVNEARLQGDYTDQTGNLRSSTGYIIVDDGKIVSESGFDIVKNGAEGSDTGRALAHSLATQYGNNLVLIIVAGMNYAVHVQNRGKDVLTSAEVLARQLLKQ